MFVSFSLFLTNYKVDYCRISVTIHRYMLGFQYNKISIIQTIQETVEWNILLGKIEQKFR